MTAKEKKKAKKEIFNPIRNADKIVLKSIDGVKVKKHRLIKVK